MLPYTREENTWLSESRETNEPLTRPLLTSDEVAAAIRRGHQLRAAAMAQLPGQIRRSVGTLARRLIRRPLLNLAGGGDSHPHGGEGFAHR